jgi:hypothetical protein
VGSFPINGKLEGEGPGPYAAIGQCTWLAPGSVGARQNDRQGRGLAIADERIILNQSSAFDANTRTRDQGHNSDTIDLGLSQE